MSTLDEQRVGFLLEQLIEINNSEDFAICCVSFKPDSGDAIVVKWGHINGRDENIFDECDVFNYIDDRIELRGNEHWVLERVLNVTYRWT